MKESQEALGSVNPPGDAHCPVWDAMIRVCPREVRELRNFTAAWAAWTSALSAQKLSKWLKVEVPLGHTEHEVHQAGNKWTC